MLAGFGACWALDWRSGWAWPLLLLSAGVGLVKGVFVLRRAAARNVQRVRTRGDGHCLGGFLSWKTWLLVLAMVALGRLLRSGLLPLPAVGFVYAAVGVALLAGSATLWNGWRTRTSACGERSGTSG